MGPLLLLLVAAVATLATAPCSSDHAGDAAEDSCDTWCSAADHVYDCTFCSCRACGFCYASNPHAKAQRKLPVDPELCAGGGTVEVMQRDDRGFRLEVVPKTWKPGTVFTFEWPAGTGIEVKQSYGADGVKGCAAGASCLRVRDHFDEHKGFGFTAKGLYAAPTVTCNDKSPPPPPPPPLPPRPPPDSPSPRDLSTSRMPSSA